MSGFEGVFSHPFIHALGWALLHFIWQGAAVTILLAGGLFLLRGHAASLRYGVALSTMLLMPLLLGITTFLIWNSSHANIAEQNEVPRSRIKKGTQIDSMREVVVDESMALSKLKKLTRAQEKSTTPSKNFASTEPLAVRWRSWVSDRLEWVLSIWLVGVLVLSLRLMVGWTQAQRIKRKGTSPVPAHWQERMTGICEKLGLKQSVRLLESVRVKVPTVIGWLRPVILLPASALIGLTPGQLEALIAHELAHIRRYDYLFNLLQTVVETLLFYHPAVWWMAKRVRIEREHCCDDFAVAVCGDALTYANALTEMEQLRNVSPQLAMVANGGSLLERIRRLIDAPAVTASTSARRLAGVVVVVTIVVMGGVAYLSSGAMAVPAKTDDTTTPSTQVTSYDKQKLLGELMRALDNEAESVREKLVETLEKIGEPAVPALIEALNDKSEDVRHEAVDALGDIGEALVN
ncbi:HEAT repeat domain-containing protein, partial [Candidatus Poribacteria bacterium]|nr:HEAT repeat domain-containing protein [Candidatus Poribacteria bacterium]